MQQLVEQQRPVASPRSRLTSRELEILTDVSHGLTVKQIAVRRAISESTVWAHRKSVYLKLGAHSASQAVAFAFQRGLL